VFYGLPCCWITDEWNRQHDGGGDSERWDLPPSGRMAATAELAIARVVGWRRASGYAMLGSESCWIERGLRIRSGDMEDLLCRNRLVERTISGSPPTFVQWPWPDRIGTPHEALRRRARLVYSDGVLVEADFGPFSTRRPLPDDWVESILDLTSLRTLWLRGAEPREADLFRALAALPMLETLEIGSRELSGTVAATIQREYPQLDVR
jgi:hypothetical protein